MKFLNNKDLYFDVSLFGNTPSLTQIRYKIVVWDYREQFPLIPLKTFNGDFFWYKQDQRLYYDFLLKNIVTYPRFDEDVMDLGVEDLCGIVNVTLSSIDGTFLETQEVVLSEFYNGSELTDVDYYPDGDVNANIIQPSNCEVPKLTDNQNYPVLLFSRNGELTSIEITDYITSLKFDEITTSGTLWFTATENDAIVRFDFKDVIEYKHVCADYMLVWYDTQGFWQSQPFWGTYENNYEHNILTNLRKETTKYQTQIEEYWNLKSDYVHLQDTYRSLFNSNQVYLYDKENNKYYKVLVQDNTFKESKSKNPFKFEIRVKYDTTYNSR